MKVAILTTANQFYTRASYQIYVAFKAYTMLSELNRRFSNILQVVDLSFMMKEFD